MAFGAATATHFLYDLNSLLAVGRDPKNPRAPQIAVTPGGDGRSWQVSVAPATAAGELFAEGPEGWFFDTMRTAQGFEVRLAEKPADPRAGAAVPILLTLVTGEQAFETRTNLDVSRSTP